MPSFDEYHRTVVGYHGTGLASALRIVNRIEGFRRSDRDYDWLGRGIYFWDHAPKQALKWAEGRQKKYRDKKNKTTNDERRATEPLAVIACMIRLGFCLDLTEPENIQYLGELFESYKGLSGNSLPRNDRHIRKLDRAVFEYAYWVIEHTEPNVSIDTARGIYVPKDGSKRIWEGSWISRDTHIQICVRNPRSLLGAWLHSPQKLEINDVCEALQAGAVPIGTEDSEGTAILQEDDQS